MEGKGSLWPYDKIPGKLHTVVKSVHTVMRPKCNGAPALPLEAPGHSSER